MTLRSLPPLWLAWRCFFIQFPVNTLAYLPSVTDRVRLNDYQSGIAGWNGILMLYLGGLNCR